MIGSSSFLQVMRTIIKAWMSSNFGMISPLPTVLAAIERLEKKIYNLVSTLATSCLIGSSSFLQVTRTTINAWMSLKFSGIPPLTAELAAFERLKKKRPISSLAF